MNLQQLNFDFEMMRWIVMSAIGIYAWVVGRQSASAKEMLDMRTRLIALEAQMKEVPSQRQLHELANNVERVSGDVRTLAASLVPMARSVDRIDNYLITNKS